MRDAFVLVKDPRQIHFSSYISRRRNKWGGYRIISPAAAEAKQIADRIFQPLTAVKGGNVQPLVPSHPRVRKDDPLGQTPLQQPFVLRRIHVDGSRRVRTLSKHIPKSTLKMVVVAKGYRVVPQRLAEGGQGFRQLHLKEHRGSFKAPVSAKDGKNSKQRVFAKGCTLFVGNVDDQGMMRYETVVA